MWNMLTLWVLTLVGARAECDHVPTMEGRANNITDAWCDVVCNGFPELSWCQGGPSAFCSCRHQPECKWETNFAGLVGNYTDAWCRSLCTALPDSPLCTSSAVCVCVPHPIESACKKHGTCMCRESDCFFDCYQKDGCMGADIHCGNNNCTIGCSGKQACQQSYMNCTEATGRCELKCDAFQSCKAPGKKDKKDDDDDDDDKKGGSERCAAIKNFAPGYACGSNATSCDIRCMADSACYSLASHCDSKNCSLACMAHRACHGAKHRCRGSCSVSCSGDRACQNVELDWEDGTQGTLNCSHRESCKNVKVVCPAEGCSVECGGGESCEGLQVTCPQERNATCTLRCSGVGACAKVRERHLCGNVTVECLGNSSCSEELWQMAHRTSVPDNEAPVDDDDADECTWIPTALGNLSSYTAPLCEAVCHDPLTYHLCVTKLGSQVCECVNGHPHPPRHHDANTSSCSVWNASTGSAFSDTFCNSVCTADPFADICAVTGACVCALPALPCDRHSECKCPSNSSCLLDCDRKEECAKSSMLCGNGTCTVSCTGPRSCAGGFINCAAGSDVCNITCSGPESCAELFRPPRPQPRMFDDNGNRDKDDDDDDDKDKGKEKVLKSTKDKGKVKDDDDDDDDNDDDDDDDDVGRKCYPEPFLRHNFEPALFCANTTQVCSVNCTGEESCKSAQLRCDSDSCDLHCSRRHSCQGIDYLCTGACSTQCTGKASCADAAIDMRNSNVAILHCNDTHSCRNTAVRCPKGEDCLIQCNGFESCKGLRLKCPAYTGGKECRIECHGDGSCNNVHDVCGNVTAVCNGNRSCSSTLLRYATGFVDECNAWKPVDGLAQVLVGGVTDAFCTSVCDRHSNNPLCSHGHHQLCTCYKADRPRLNLSCEWEPTDPIFAFVDCPGLCHEDHQFRKLCSPKAGFAQVCRCKKTNERGCKATEVCTDPACQMQCNANRSCKQKSLVCATNSNACHIDCTSGFCNGAQAICHADTCSLRCVGEGACDAMVGCNATGRGYGYYCSDATQACKQICDGTGSCLAATTYCNGIVCEEVCTGQHSCRSASLTCNATNSCNVQCTGTHACEQYALDARHAESTLLQCSNTGSCKNVSVNCTNSGNCLVVCSGESSCRDLGLSCPTASANQSCVLQCSGKDSCDFPRRNVSGAVTFECTGQGSCPQLNDTQPPACGRWVLKANLGPAAITVKCDTVCGAVGNHRLCTQFCECEPEPQTSVTAVPVTKAPATQAPPRGIDMPPVDEPVAEPTQAPDTLPPDTKAPSTAAPSRDVDVTPVDTPFEPLPDTSVPLGVAVVRQVVHRLILALALALFDGASFIEALLRVLGASAGVSTIVLHWVCPSSACNGGCPATQTEKLAAGCRSGSTLSRAAAVLQATDGTMVEMGSDGDDAVVSSAIDSEIQKGDSSPLAEFGVQSNEMVETEVLVTTTPVPTAKDESSSSNVPLILAIVIPVVVLLLVGGAVLVFCCRSKQSAHEPAEREFSNIKAKGSVV